MFPMTSIQNPITQVKNGCGLGTCNSSSVWGEAEQKQKEKKMERDWRTSNVDFWPPCAHAHICIHAYNIHICTEKFQNEMPIPVEFVCVLPRAAGSQVSSFAERINKHKSRLWILWVGFPFSSYSPFGILIYFHSIGVLNVLRKQHLDVNAKPEIGQRMSNSRVIL